MTKYDAEWRADALRECWEKKLTPRQCAEYIGVTRAMVYAIFAGREWKAIPRPEGFVYPFPGVLRQEPKPTTEKAHYLAEYVRLRQTPAEFAEMLGIKIPSAYRILLGFAWKEVERPPGFQYPWPDRRWSRRKLCP